MKMIRSVLAGALLLSTTYIHAQTADDVINKHIAAIGGKDVINKIKSQVIEADISVMGSTLPSTTTLLPGKGFRNVANFNGQEIIQCITPTSGWMINPLAGVTDAQAIPEEQLKEAQPALEVGGALFNYKEKGSKAELVGNEMIDDVNAIKIKLTSKAGKESFYYIDPTTNYLLKNEVISNVQGQNVSVVSYFSDYKKTNIGLVIPYTTILNQGFEMTIKTNKVEFNKEIDLKIFEMPK